METMIAYKGFQILPISNWNAEINGFSFTLTVYESNSLSGNDFLFIEKSQITNWAITSKYDRNSINAEQELRNNTMAKAKARIDLGMFDKGQEYFQLISIDSKEEKSLPIDDETIQDYLLKGLLNLRRLKPQGYMFEQFDPRGFCEIIKISFDQYLFNADLLMEDHYIETRMEGGINHGMIYITSSGVKKVNDKYRDVELKKISSRLSSQDSNNEKFDVAISFAGEDRVIAEDLAKRLKMKNVVVFYDSFEKSDMWGKNLYDYLTEVYSEKSKYCIILISENYSKKNWTTLERQSAQARAFRENREYILPLRLDDTKLMGLNETIGYIDYNAHKVDEIIDLVVEKLKKI